MELGNNTQDYFWTSEWQEGEKVADEDIRTGRTKRFSTVEELIANLNSSVEDDYVWNKEG